MTAFNRFFLVLSLLSTSALSQAEIETKREKFECSEVSYGREIDAAGTIVSEDRFEGIRSKGERTVWKTAEAIFQATVSDHYDQIDGVSYVSSRSHALRKITEVTSANGQTVVRVERHAIVASYNKDGVLRAVKEKKQIYEDTYETVNGEEVLVKSLLDGVEQPLTKEKSEARKIDENRREVVTTLLEPYKVKLVGSENFYEQVSSVFTCVYEKL